MNIAIFTDTYYPEINGVATSVLTLKNELEKMGHNVYVFTTTTPNSPECEHNVFRVPSLPCVLISERRIGMFYVPKLAGTIKKLNLDIIHTHTEFSLGIFGRIMAKELNLPLVHTYHTIYEDYTHYLKLKGLDKGAKAFVRGYTKYCCNTVQVVVAPTEKVKDLLTDYSVYRHIEIIPTGIDLHKFEDGKWTEQEIEKVKLNLNILSKDKVILYIGRISKEKNLEEIVLAIPKFMEKHKDSKFVIVGNGPDKGRLEKIVGSLDCKEQIIFAGEQPWDEIGKFYKIGDVFVSASQSETQGLTYIEAMASGLPVVAKDDRCLDGILLDGENGYRFHDEIEFMHGLEKVLYGDMANRYGVKSKQLVQSYSNENFAKKVEKVYAGILQGEYTIDEC